MQNQYKINDIGRFSEYATLLKSTQPDAPTKLLVLLNRNGESTTFNAQVDHNEWWAFCHLKYENHIQLFKLPLGFYKKVDFLCS